MNLVVFLSDRCNMACDYCFLKLNEGRATVLSVADARLAVEAHLKHSPGGQVTVLGGEPLLHQALLEEVAAVCAYGSGRRRLSRIPPIALVRRHVRSLELTP